MRTAIVYITNRCNQHCVFCLEADPTWPTFTEPSTEAVFRDLDRLRARGSEHITFMGGETMFRKDLPQILAHTKALGFTRVGITTNGTILGKPGFLQRMVDAGLEFIELSLHGHTEALANSIGGTDFTFQRQARALAEIDQIGTLPIIVNVVICRENKDHAVDIARYLLGGFPRIPVRFKYKFVAQMGRAASRADQEMLRYSEVDALAVGDYLDAHEVPFWYDNFPLCRLGRHAGHSRELSAMASDERYFDYDHQDNREYLDTGYQLLGRCWPECCVSCTLRPVCSGIENTYHRRQGAGELSPRSDDPLPLLASALGESGLDPATAPQRLEALRREPRPQFCPIDAAASAASASVDERGVRVRLERGFVVELQVELSDPDRPAYARIGPFSLSYRSRDASVYERPGVRELLVAAAEALREHESSGSLQAAGAAIAAAAATLGWTPAADAPAPTAPREIQSLRVLPACAGRQRTG